MLKVLIESADKKKHVCISDDSEEILPENNEESNVFILKKDFQLKFWGGDYECLSALVGKVIQSHTGDYINDILWLGLPEEIDLNTIVKSAIDNGNIMSILAAIEIVGNTKMFPLWFSQMEDDIQIRYILVSSLKGMLEIRERNGKSKIKIQKITPESVDNKTGEG